MSGTSEGMLFLILAAVMNASFTLPMKFAGRWAWENTWLAWTIFALLVLPPGITLLTVPHLGDIYSSTSSVALLSAVLFGAGWGVAQVFFGLAVDAIGIALTFSLVLGTSAAVGTIIPLLRLHADRLHTQAGHLVIASVALVLVGVLICAIAGRQRERAMRSTTAGIPEAGTVGLLLAILCGFGASFVNLGLSFGAPLISAARSNGASELMAPNAVWFPLMMAGAIPNLLYCAWLLKKNQSFPRYRLSTAGHWVLALLMAIFWFGSTLVYGAATQHLGALGPVLGWPLFMSLIVITASLLGMMTGEWRQSGRGPLSIQLAGVVVLVLAVFLLAHTSQMVS